MPAKSSTMADLIAFQTYHHTKLRPPSKMIPRQAHKRSLSSEHRTLSPDRTVIKAKSTTDLSEIASKTGPTPSLKFEESNFNTLQDPRLAVSTEVLPPISPTHHPDLSNEVAALSVKLVQAINNQTTLDDSLVATRQELEIAQSKIQALEFQNEKYRRDLDEKVYIRKSEADREISQLYFALAEEKAQRAIIEQGKKTIEQELEALTADLFEEANKMVAAAKIERDAVEKKNEQLRSQIRDTELLLASHQDQLAELKSVMQGMKISKDDVDTRPSTLTAPPSPAAPSVLTGSTMHGPDIAHVAATPCNRENLVPGPSSNIPHLIRMVCRTDLQAYEDFRELLVLSRSSKPSSRAGSGSYAGLNVMSLAGFGGGGSNSATSSPTKGFASSPNGSLSSHTGSHIPLKETRFYKRVLMEDIEPTLRLDLAPGISWLTRRTVLSSICDGTLVVEPIPSTMRKYEFPCSVCGERRQGPRHERTHRFRTSDSENAQRYSLCLQCLERVRSCCEFTSFLRLILDGHLKAGDVDEEKEVWEEINRLRERMFWSRIAGGIIPLVGPPMGADTCPHDEATNKDVPKQDEPPNLDHPLNAATQSQLGETSAVPETFQQLARIAVADTSSPGVPVARLSTPEPHPPNETDTHRSLEVPSSKRSSVKSDDIVYKEADGHVPTTPTVSIVGQSLFCDEQDGSGIA